MNLETIMIDETQGKRLSKISTSRGVVWWMVEMGDKRFITSAEFMAWAKYNNKRLYREVTV